MKTRGKKMGPADVIDMLLSCFNESESNGFEVAEACGASWHTAEGVTPKLIFVKDCVMMFEMPDGSQVRINATKVRS
jgi:hypothetical protein